MDEINKSTHEWARKGEPLNAHRQRCRKRIRSTSERWESLAQNKSEVFSSIVGHKNTYTLSQKNICTQKKSSYNHETRQECSLVRDMQMIKISKPMRQG
ncbi:hypothetical protein TNCV_1741801 [Trichonephila clavipes]|nr:hypothetical protein TNCV_1741801 [Trichonephila clavipes]